MPRPVTYQYYPHLHLQSFSLEEKQRPWGTPETQPCHGHVQIPCTRPAMKGRQLLMLPRMYSE